MNSDWKLPLSTFEEYMLLDDRASHPMASFLEIDLSGDIETAILQQALPKALERHPLLKSILRPSPSPGSQQNGRLSWVLSTEEISISTLAAGRLPHPEPFDLHSSPGLRIWAQPTADGVTLVLYVHHAICDALGMLTFVTDWLMIAAGLEASLPASTVHALPDREDLTGRKATFPLSQRLRNTIRYLFGKSPVPLTIPHASPLGVNSHPDAGTADSHYHIVSLSESEFTALQAAARAQQASINDWLSACLFLTIQEWEEQHQRTPRRGPRRILIPVNRRTHQQRYFSACNVLGYKMLTRELQTNVSFQELLNGIRNEMRPVRTNPRGVHSFIRMLRLMRRFGMLPRIVRKYDCFATVILSNLGDVSAYFSPLLGSPSIKAMLQPGDIRIHAIRCAPPRRPNTHLTLVAMSYGGELQLMSSRTSRGLDAAQTLQFLNCLKEHVLRTTECEQEPRFAMTLE